MVDNNDGVVVRFSVANAEVVRNALAQLGKDGEKALKQLDATSGPVNAKMQALSDIVDVAKGRLSGFAAQGGMVGNVVGRWGPIGFAAAAGLGIAYATLEKLSSIAGEFADKVRNMRESSREIQFTTDALQVLGREASKSGVDFDSMVGSLGKFAVAMDEVRKGQGALFDAVRRVNPQLALQMAASNDNAAAFDLLSRAIAKAGLSEQAMLKAAFGRGGLPMAPVLQSVFEGGGLNAKIADDASKGKIMTQEYIDRLSKLKIEIDRTYGSAQKFYALTVSETTLENQLKFAKSMETLAWSFSLLGKIDLPLEALKLLLNPASAIGSVIGIAANNQIAPYLPKRPQVMINGGGGWGDPKNPNYTGAAEGPPKPAPDPHLAERMYNLYREEISLLGQAATQAEQYKLKELELAAAIEKDASKTEAANRALGAYVLQQFQAETAARERLGVITEDQLLVSKLTDLQDLRAKGFIRSDAEMAEAERLVRKEVQDTMDALKVRGSNLPGLKQLELDAGNLSKQFDQLGTSGLATLSSGLTEIERGTKSVKDGVKDMGSAFVKTMFDMVNRMLIALTVGRLLQTTFNSFVGGGAPGGAPAIPTIGAAGGLAVPTYHARGSAFGPFGIVRPFAKGGVFTNSIVSRPTMFQYGGAFGVMGEKTEEGVLPLRRTAKGELGVIASGGRGAPVVNNFQIINNSSARVTERRRSNATGGVDFVAMIDDAVAGAINSGSSRTHDALVSRFRLDPTRGMA